MKGIGLLQKPQPILPRTSLLTIYKSFIRPQPHLDYGDVVYDQPSHDAFYKKLETVQYNTALAITASIKGTSHEKLYQELAQPAFTCSKLTIETLEQGVKYVQS